MSVTTGSISAALLGVSGHAHKHWGSEFTSRAVIVRVLALMMMGISIGMAVYAAYNFKKRGDMLAYVRFACRFVIVMELLYIVSEFDADNGMQICIVAVKRWMAHMMIDCCQWC